MCHEIKIKDLKNHPNHLGSGPLILTNVGRNLREHGNIVAHSYQELINYQQCDS